MKNELTPLIIDGIYDIQPPISPALSGLEINLIILIFILILSVLFYAVWNHYYSTKGRAKRNIKKLHVKYSTNKITPHDAVYQLSLFLRQGLKLNHIGKNTLLPKKLDASKSEWDIFKNNISNLRYKKNIKSYSDISTLFDNSLFWLKMWP
jgi:hypothetical protein